LHTVQASVIFGRTSLVLLATGVVLVAAGRCRAPR
jgi:hypothetical protein